MSYRMITVAALLCCAAPARADLTGSSVTGSLTFARLAGSGFGGSTNYFDPANANYPSGSVPPAYGNAHGTTVAIGPVVEFGYFSRLDGHSADFSANTLLITYTCNIPSCNFGGDATYTFNDAAFSGRDVAFLSNGLGLSAMLSGDMLTLYQPDATLPAGSTSSELNLSSSTAPEPSSLALLGTGILGLLSVARRRLQR